MSSPSNRGRRMAAAGDLGVIAPPPPQMLISGEPFEQSDVPCAAEPFRALRESEMRKRAILESALDCIISIDHEGRVAPGAPALGKPRGAAFG